MTVLAEQLAEPERAPETETDTRILEAALELVGEYGEDRITMDDIATRAGVNRVTVFRRFGSKDEVITRTYLRAVRFALDGMEDAARTANDLGSALARAFSHLLAHSLENAVMQRLGRSEPAVLVRWWREGDPSGLELIRSWFRGIAGDYGPGGVSPETLDELCDALSRLFFSCLVLPAAGRTTWFEEESREAAAMGLVAAVLERDAFALDALKGVRNS